MTASNDRTRWTDDRIDELASSVSELRATAEALLQVAQIHQADIEAIGRDTQGLKLEVRRLVEELRQRRGEE